MIITFSGKINTEEDEDSIMASLTRFFEEVQDKFSKIKHLNTRGKKNEKSKRQM